MQVIKSHLKVNASHMQSFQSCFQIFLSQSFALKYKVFQILIASFIDDLTFVGLRWSSSFIIVVREQILKFGQFLGSFCIFRAPDLTENKQNYQKNQHIVISLLGGKK